MPIILVTRQPTLGAVWRRNKNKEFLKGVLARISSTGEGPGWEDADAEERQNWK